MDRRVIDMRTLDEAIAKEKEEAKRLRKIIETGYDGEISIEAIFCDDTDAIKEAYERFENCAKEHEQYAEWLEELKALRLQNHLGRDEALIAGRKEGYNKAIDDFVESLKEKYACCGYVEELAEIDIDEIAEQLKAGESE